MSIAELDQHEWDVSSRRADRYRQRGQENPDDTVDRRHLRVAQGRPPFEIVDPPRSAHDGTIPQVRHELIAFAKAHPDRWVRYNAAGYDDAAATTLRKYIGGGTGGFGPGFRYRIRNSRSDHPDFYVLYRPIGGDL